MADELNRLIKKAVRAIEPCTETVYITTDGKEFKHLAVARNYQRYLKARETVLSLETFNGWFRCNSRADAEAVFCFLSEGEASPSFTTTYPCLLSASWDDHDQLFDFNFIAAAAVGGIASALGVSSADRIGWLERAIEYALNHLKSGVIDNDSRIVAIHRIEHMRHHATIGDPCPKEDS